MTQTPNRTVVLLHGSGTDRRPAIEALRSAGFQVRERVHGSPNGALGPSDVDLLLLDSDLPESTARTICREMRTCGGLDRVPVLRLSAEGMDAAILDSGADGCLPEWADARVLIANVRALLRLRGREVEAHKELSHWQALFDAIEDSICLLDDRGEIVNCNQAFARIAARPLEHILGRKYGDVLQCTEEAPEGLPMRCLRSGNREGSSELVMDNRCLRLTVHPLTEPVHDRVGAVCTLQDVTQRKWAEQTLLQGAERHHRLAEEALVGLPHG
ncbi:MAG: PAS domain-containing protein [Planctomycetes bacterium]|nr:PAS domain-containing protein [Planctomycetota bacterium]